MNCTLVGYRKTAFKPKDSDREIKGVNLYVTYPDANVDGVVAERLFVTEDRLGVYSPFLGDQLVIEFNRYGKVGGVALSGKLK